MFSSIHHLHSEKKRGRNALFLLLWCAFACFLFSKCRYGFGNIDEAFYLTVPMRLLQGDALFLHEWHLSQMSGFLLAPLVSLVLRLNQGTEGIILLMRYMYTACQCLAALAIYLRLRRYSWIGAACAALSFMIFVPAGLMALSYNSMGILLLALSGLALLPVRRHGGLFAFASGVAFAMAVLCCPYLMLVYLVYVLACAAELLVFRARHARAGASFLSVRSLLLFTAGAVAIAAVFAAFVLIRAPLDGILQAFSQIMNDPEHPPISLFLKIKAYLRVILFSTPRTKYLYPLLALLFAACLADKRRKSRPLVYFIPAALCTLLMMVDHYLHWQYLNMVMWSVSVLAVFVLLLSRESINRRLFQLFWIPGMLYSFCIHLSSNQEFYAITSAAVVATLGSIAMIALFFREAMAAVHRRAVRAALCCLLCAIMGFQILSQADLRWRLVFWEDGIGTQTRPVSEGIQAGLLVSEEMEQEYADALHNLDVMKPYAGKKLLYLSRNTWYYLVHDCEIAAYSAWLSGVDENTVARLEAYYALNPDKLPDAVYADEEHRQSALLLADALGYRARSVDGGMLLEK